MRHLTARDFQVSTWSGGRTIQIAISPEGAVYADRDFLWRVSSATVELEESDFTALSDYDRWILPLSGPIRLSHNGGAEINLAPNEAHFFDGAERTHCRGRCTDFNLMLRKGRCQGRIRALAEDAELNREGVKILYCVKGTVTVNGLALKEYEAARLEDGESGTARIASHGHAVLAEVQEA